MGAVSAGDFAEDVLAISVEAFKVVLGMLNSLRRTLAVEREGAVISRGASRLAARCASGAVLLAEVFESLVLAGGLTGLTELTERVGVGRSFVFRSASTFASLGVASEEATRSVG